MRAERFSGTQKGPHIDHVIEIPSPKLLWTTSESGQVRIIDRVLRNNNPFYFAVATILKQEGINLRNLTNERIRLRQENAYLNNKPMDDLGKENGPKRALADAYIDLFEELRWAKMLDETNSTIEDHPNFIDDNKPIHPEIDKRLVVDVNIFKEQKEEDQRVLQIIRDDKSGFRLLDLLEKQHLERLQRAGWDDPKSRDEFTGFQKAINRYKELYEKHLRSRISTQTILPRSFIDS